MGNIKITELQSDNQIYELSNEELRQVVGGTLQNDLNDFLALIPVADIKSIFLDYLANDSE